MKMQIDLKNNTNGRPTVDLNAELYTDISEELYVSRVAIDWEQRTFEINLIPILF